MSEMEQEVVDLLKELVGRLQSLERTVYDSENILMKSGFVKVDSPTPAIAAASPDGIDSSAIAKMDWSEINDIVAKIEGR